MQSAYAAVFFLKQKKHMCKNACFLLVNSERQLKSAGKGVNTRGGRHRKT